MIVAVGVAKTVTATGNDVDEQPNAFVKVAVYVPEVVTLIDCVVELLLHKYEVAVPAVNVTLPPGQKEVGPFETTVAIGEGFTVTFVVVEVAEQPLAFVTIT